MKIWHLMKSGYAKSLLTLCLLQQLTACGGSDSAVIIDLGPVPGSVSLAWPEPDKREDGTDLSSGEIAGYRVYYGTTAGDYQREIDTFDVTISVDDLTANETYYFVVTAYDTDGRESLYSSESSVTIPSS